MKADEKRKAKKQGQALPNLIKVLTPHLATRHGVYLLVYVVSLCTRILITIKIATTAGVLTSFMSTRDWNKMFMTQAKFGCLCFLASFNTAVMKFLEKRVALSVRDILFKYLVRKLVDSKTQVGEWFHWVGGGDRCPSSTRIFSEWQFGAFWCYWSFSETLTCILKSLQTGVLPSHHEGLPRATI